MSQKILIPSVQGGPFDKNNRMIDFNVPNDGSMVDMSQSYVQLVCYVESSTAGVHNVGVQFTSDSQQALSNVDLIKNCSFSNDKSGKIEDIREVGFLTHTLNEYLQSNSKKYSQIYSLHNKVSPQGLLYSPFVEMHKEGSYKSRMIETHLRIPMKDLFSIGDTMYPLGTLGKTRIHLELDDISSLRIQPIFLDLTNNTAISLANVNATGGNSFSVSSTYSRLENSPLYVGMPITIKEGSSTLLTTEISSIEYTQQTGTLTFTTLASLPSRETNYANLSLNKIAPANLKFVVSQANLGLTLIQNQKPVSVFEYTTFTSEQSTVNSTHWQKIYELEPSCQNLFIMSKHSDSLFSKQKQLKSYRLRIDGVDVVDREIEINYGSTAISEGGINKLRNPLYYDLIYKTMLNAGYSLASLCENTQKAKETVYNNLFNDDLSVLLCCPTPETMTYKQFQLNLDGDDAIETLILYKQVVKQIKV